MFDQYTTEITYKEFRRNHKLFGEGEFDGKMGLEPTKPEDWNYFEGWCSGYRERICKKLGITLPSEF